MKPLLRPIAWFDIDPDHEFYERREPVECILECLMKDALLKLESEGTAGMDFPDIEYTRYCALLETFLKLDVSEFLKKITENKTRWRLLIWGTVSEDRIATLEIKEITSSFELEEDLKDLQERYLRLEDSSLAVLRPVFVSRSPVWGLKGDKVQIAEGVLYYDEQLGYPNSDSNPIVYNTFKLEHQCKAKNENDFSKIEIEIQRLV